MGIRTCFRHHGVAFVGLIQYAPTRVTCRTSKYEYVFRTGYMFWLGIRACFRHQWVAFVGRMLLRPYTCYMPYIEIWTCFPNGVYVSVGDTDMFSPPMGGVHGAYAVAPLHALHAIHRNTEMFFERGICFGWGYGHVFATYGWRLWGVFNTPLHVLHAVHQNTETFFKRGIYFGWGYGRVISIKACPRL